MYGSFARAEAEYYSDQLRERQIAECEWHEGQPKRGCPDCEGEYEVYCEMLADADREERASRE